MVVPTNNMRAMGVDISTQALHACTVKRPVVGPKDVSGRVGRTRERVPERRPRDHLAEAPTQRARQPCTPTYTSLPHVKAASPPIGGELPDPFFSAHFRRSTSFADAVAFVPGPRVTGFKLDPTLVFGALPQK